MQFRLRTLLIVLAVGPPLVAVVIALGISLWQLQQDDDFLEKLYAAEKLMDGRDIPDTFIGYGPPD